MIIPLDVGHRTLFPRIFYPLVVKVIAKLAMLKRRKSISNLIRRVVVVELTGPDVGRSTAYLFAVRNRHFVASDDVSLDLANAILDVLSVFHFNLRPPQGLRRANVDAA